MRHRIPEEGTEMKVTLLNYAISRDHIASLHKAGCKDIDRDARTHAAELYDYDSKDAALADYVDGEMAEMGYSVGDVKIYPCCKEVAATCVRCGHSDATVGNLADRITGTVVVGTRYCADDAACDRRSRENSETG